MIGSLQFVDPFAQLQFSFEESRLPDGGSVLVGYAPDGRVGILEVEQQETRRRVSLLISADADRRTRLWSATCLATLASVLGLDFPGWLREQIQTRGTGSPWSTWCVLREMHISASFYPLDAVLVTIEELS